MHDHDPPLDRCRLCQLAGLVPFPGDMPAPDWWSPPPGSPAATGDWPAAAPAPKPRVSIAELAARRRH